MKITSLQNPKIKQLVQLQKASERKEQQLFIVEGQREIFLAIQAGYDIKSIFYCNDYKNQRDVKYPLELEKLDIELFDITNEVFDKIAYRENTTGLVALAAIKNTTLQDISLPEKPLIVVLENIEKPGNIGAILRTADAAGVDLIMLCNQQTDLYNANIIRSSVGCVFTNKIVNISNEEAFQFLKQHQVAIYTTYLEAAVSYHAINYKNPTAIVVGSEAHGVSAFWQQHADENIIIPMQGKIDSINVSTAAAIIIFEAKRQRDFL